MVEEIRDKKAIRHAENKIVKINASLVVITLSVNGVYTATKRQIDKWI